MIERNDENHLSSSLSGIGRILGILRKPIMSNPLMPFAGNLMTTGMGVLPHKTMESALSVAMSVDMPATCALMNPDGFETVEKAYDWLKRLSRLL